MLHYLTFHINYPELGFVVFLLTSAYILAREGLRDLKGDK